MASPPKLRKPYLIAGIAIAAVVVLIALVLIIVRAKSASPLQAAYNTCSLSGQSGASLGDNGQSLVLDGRGEEDYSGVQVAQQACVLAELKVPDSVIAKIEATRALDGRQVDSWDGVSASWSYHPDTGLNLILSTN